jgi:hypothetical protein
VCRRISRDHLKRSFQFFPVIAIARPSRAQELMRMRLHNRGAGSHDFPSLAPFVPRSRDQIKTTMRRRKRREVGEGSLPCSVFGAIYIHNHILLT